MLISILAGVLFLLLLALQLARPGSEPPGASIALSGGTVRPTSTSLRLATVTSWATEKSSRPDATVTPVLPGAAPPTQAPSNTATPEAMAEVREPYTGVWISAAELAQLPTSGPAWQHLKDAADSELREPRLRNQDQDNNVLVLAAALVYARTGEMRYRDKVIDNLMAAIGTEEGGRTLALGRELVAYVIAADLINLPANKAEDEAFRTWLREVLTKQLKDERTLQLTHEERPNNWGTHAGASRAAVALYLQDEAELERTAVVFKGYLGDRSAYDGFIYGNLSWQYDPDNPVGVNPKGATKEGHSIDGALPEEMRRGSKFRWPPKWTNYPWEALQGALVQAEILCRAGYPVWEWEDSALLRAVEFLYAIDWPPEGDDEWQVWLVNYAYGTDFPGVVAARPGKNFGWTDWTHSEFRAPRGQQGGC